MGCRGRARRASTGDIPEGTGIFLLGNAVRALDALGYGEDVAARAVYIRRQQTLDLKQYRDLRAELAGRSVDLQWRVIDSTQIRDTHDRWVIGADTARNVPNVNAIYTGQHSEMHASPSRAELSGLFDGYWAGAAPFDPAEAQVAAAGSPASRPPHDLQPVGRPR